MNALALAPGRHVRPSRMAGLRRGMLARMEDTMILPAGAAKRALPVVPALAAAVVVALAAAGYFAFQAAGRAEAIAAANAATDEVRGQLTRAQARIRQLDAELAAKQTELASALRTLPVDVRFNVVDGQLVASFENHATRELDLVVEPRRARTGEYSRLDITVAAQGVGSIGEKQGWGFKSGDTLTVTAGDFKPVSLAVP